MVSVPQSSADTDQQTAAADFEASRNTLCTLLSNIILLPVKTRDSVLLKCEAIAKLASFIVKLEMAAIGAG